MNLAMLLRSQRAVISITNGRVGIMIFGPAGNARPRTRILTRAQAWRLIQAGFL